MVVYDFNKASELSEEDEGVENARMEMETIRNISFDEMCWKLFVTFGLGIVIFYIQHFLFIESHEAKSYENRYYMAIFTIFIISEMVKSPFSFRMFWWNNYINDDKHNMSIVFVTAFFMTASLFFQNFYCKSTDYEKLSWDIKFIYLYVVSPTILFLQIASFLGHVLISYYVIRIRYSKSIENIIKFSKLLTKTESDVALLSLLDCFLRTAPLMTIQATYLLENPENILHIPGSQIVSILISIFLMPWSITSYQGALRMNRHFEIPVKTKTLYFLWHFFIMVSRISSIAAVEVFWPVHLAFFVFLHSFCATLWLLNKTEPMDFCGNNKFFHFLFCCVFGCVYIFYPVNVVKENTRWKYFWFYAIVFVENVVTNAFWFDKEDKMNHYAKIAFLGVNFTFFALGIVCMVLYYQFYHHKNNSDNDIIKDSSYPLCTIATN